MYPTDVREFTTQRLVAQIAQALRNETVLELGSFYAELNLAPTATTSFHAAAAAVHVLLAHGADPSPAADPAPALLATRANGHAPKAAAGEPAPARRKYARRKVAKSSSSRKSRRTPTEKCTICGRPLTSPGMLARHMRQKHPVIATAETAT